jgi:hypothetical protein
MPSLRLDGNIRHEQTERSQDNRCNPLRVRSISASPFGAPGEIRHPEFRLMKAAGNDENTPRHEEDGGNPFCFGHAKLQDKFCENYNADCIFMSIKILTQ